MQLRILHTTRFDYEKPAFQSHNEIRMRPLDSPAQRCVKFDLDTLPAASTFEYCDYYGNRVHAVSIHPPHSGLTVVARSTVERMQIAAPLVVATTFKTFLLNDHGRSLTEYDFLSASRHIPFSEP